MPRTSKTPPHPLWLWMNSQPWGKALGVKYEIVARLANISAGYVRIISTGHQRPYYDIAEVLSNVTGNAVTVDQIMKFPYRNRVKKNRAA